MTRDLLGQNIYIYIVNRYFYYHHFFIIIIIYYSWYYYYLLQKILLECVFSIIVSQYSDACT